MIENVLHYHRSTWDVATLTVLKEWFVGWWTDDMSPHLSDQISLTRIKVTDLTSEVAPALDFTISPPIAGAITGVNAVANHTVAVFTFRTSFRGRSYRGRMFLGGLSVPQTEDNYVVAANQAVLEPLVQGIKTVPVGAETTELEIVSFMHNKEWRTTAVCTPVETIGLNGKLGTLRRRMPGYGR